MGPPNGKLILTVKVLQRRAPLRLSKEAGRVIAASAAASLPGQLGRGPQARARQAGCYWLE